MDILSHIVEVGATFTECVLVLSVITEASGRRFSAWKNLFLLIVFSLYSTALVTILNCFKSFSYITL